MPDLILLPVEAELAVVFDFSDMVIAPATLISVTVTAPAPLTLFGQTDDLPNNRTTIGVKGALHGETYVVQAIGATSTGEKIPKDATFQGWNG